jgi:hypothetical protein
VDGGETDVGVGRRDDARVLLEAAVLLPERVESGFGRRLRGRHGGVPTELGVLKASPVLALLL